MSVTRERLYAHLVFYHHLFLAMKLFSYIYGGFWPECQWRRLLYYWGISLEGRRNTRIVYESYTLRVDIVACEFQISHNSIQVSWYLNPTGYKGGANRIWRLPKCYLMNWVECKKQKKKIRSISSKTLLNICSWLLKYYIS